MGSLYLQILGVPSVPRFPRAGPGPGRISAAFQDGTGPRARTVFTWLAAGAGEINQGMAGFLHLCLYIIPGW